MIKKSKQHDAISIQICINEFNFKWKRLTRATVLIITTHSILNDPLMCILYADSSKRIFFKQKK
jgi:hypothetical protein